MAGLVLALPSQGVSQEPPDLGRPIRTSPWISTNSGTYRVSEMLDRGGRATCLRLEGAGSGQVAEDELQGLVWAMSFTEALREDTELLDVLRKLALMSEAVSGLNYVVENATWFQDFSVRLGVHGTAAYLTGGASVPAAIEGEVVGVLVNAFTESPRRVALAIARRHIDLATLRYLRVRTFASALTRDRGRSSSSPVDLSDLESAWADVAFAWTTSTPMAHYIVDIQPGTGVSSQLARLGIEATKAGVGYTPAGFVASSLIETGQFIMLLTGMGEAGHDLGERLDAARSELWRRLPPPPGIDAGGSPANPLPPLCSTGSSTEAAVVFLLDSSGSLEQNDPRRVRIRTSQLLVDHLGPDAEFGVIDFDSGARALTLAPVAGQPERVKQLIASIDADGGTNIAAGLRESMRFIQSAGLESRSPWIVLFTDGRTEGPPLEPIVDELASRAWPIAAVGLSTAVNEPLLRTLAEETNGVYYQANRAEDLVDLFELVAFRVKGGVVSQTLTGEVHENRPVTHSFLVDPGLKSVLISLTWPGSELDLVLRDPHGDVPPADRVRRVEAETYEILELLSPDPGEWTVEVNPIVIRRSEPYVVRIGGRSAFSVDLGLPSEGTLAQGQTLELPVEVGVEAPGWDRVDVRLRIRDGSGQTVHEEEQRLSSSSLRLRSEFSGREVGRYELRADLTGRGAAGEPVFRRELRKQFSVVPRSLPDVDRLVPEGGLRLSEFLGERAVDVGPVTLDGSKNRLTVDLGGLLPLSEQVTEDERLSAGITRLRIEDRRDPGGRGATVLLQFSIASYRVTLELDGPETRSGDGPPEVVPWRLRVDEATAGRVLERDGVIRNTTGG